MEIFSFISQWIPADFILIIAGLIVVGEMLKKFTTLPSQLLTTVLPILGAIIIGIMYTTTTEIFVIADLIKQICIGLVIGWAATGGYEFLKNITTDSSNFLKKEIIYTSKNIEENCENEKITTGETGETEETEE